MFDQAQPIGFVVENFVLSTTKPIPAMVQRAVNVNATAGVVDSLAQYMNTKASDVVSEIELANVAPGILSQSLAPSRSVGIVHGWETRRFRFNLTVGTQQSDGSYVRSYVQGYTEHADITFNNTVDPNMPFFLNSIITVRISTDPMTNIPTSRLMSAFTVIHDPVHGASLVSDNEMMRHFRPHDVMAELATRQQYNLNPNEATLASNIVGIDPVMSKASNMLQLSHAAQVLSAIPMSADTGDIGYNPSDFMFNAAGVVSDGTTDNIPFFTVMKNMRATYIDPSSFTLGELASIDPNTDNQTKVFVNDGQSAIVQSNIQMFNTDNFASLETPTRAAMIASTVAEESAGLAMKNMLTHVTFSVTNRLPSGESIITIQNGNSVIAELDVSFMLERFKNAFMLLIFNKLTENGAVGVELLVDIDIYGDCLISVGVEGDYNYTFNIPTYADNLHTSMVLNAQAYTNAVNAYDGLLNMLSN